MAHPNAKPPKGLYVAHPPNQKPALLLSSLPLLELFQSYMKVDIISLSEYILYLPSMCGLHFQVKVTNFYMTLNQLVQCKFKSQNTTVAWIKIKHYEQHKCLTAWLKTRLFDKQGFSIAQVHTCIEKVGVYVCFKRLVVNRHILWFPPSAFHRLDSIHL